MAEIAYLRNKNTNAVIAVPVPPRGLHRAYSHGEWEPCEKPAPKKNTSRPPAEPVPSQPASTPVSLTKE